jgi:hypothetical protein
MKCKLKSSLRPPGGENERLKILALKIKNVSEEKMMMS